MDIRKKHILSKNLFFEQLIILLETEDWNYKLLQIIDKKCHFPSNYHLVLFPQEEVEMFEEFEKWQDEKMLEILARHESPLKTREKIAKALKARIIGVVPKSVILKQQAWFMQPSNIFLGAACSARTCDLIWHWAGDKSDDFNYYTKRGLLLGVYIAARLFYLSDDSPDFASTKKFIADSLNSIINIAHIKSKIKFPGLEDIPILRMFL